MSDPLIFLGYRAKKPWRPTGTWDSENRTGVTEVCSACDCLVEPPPAWIKTWSFNQATCWATAAEALAVVPDEQRADYPVFAYWLVLAGKTDSTDLFDARRPPLPRDRGPTDLPVLGYDVVSIEPSLPCFGHSPLSCNGYALKVAVNCWCLIDVLDDARAFAVRCDAEQPEPGRYVVIRIARIG